MNSLSITVTDENLADETDAWEDGAEYDLRVRQTAPGKFEMVSGEVVEEEAVEPPPPPKKIPAAMTALAGE